MDIFLNVSRQVKVDDVLHIWNIQTSGGNSGGHNDRSLSSFKSKYLLLKV